MRDSFSGTFILSGVIVVHVLSLKKNESYVLLAEFVHGPDSPGAFSILARS